MYVEQGISTSTDPGRAVEEATHEWQKEPEILFVFCSSSQPAAEVAKELSARYPGVPLVGCTTAGEYLSGQHYNGSVVVAGLCETGIRWRAALIEDLAGFDAQRSQELASELFSSLEIEREEMDPEKYFCLLMIDGLSMQEEKVSMLLSDAIEGIPLAGGSAGDDLQFARTEILFGSVARSDAAVVVMGELSDQVEMEIVKHQHFITTPQALVITEADPASRRVLEMDGYPACEAYARALGLEGPEELSDEITFLNPVTFSCNGEIYVRSIQKLNEDGSITFYCGIEEGMVLEIGGHEDIADSLDRDFRRFQERGPAAFTLGFNCILRSLEAGQEQRHESLSECYNRLSRAMIGFDTYGEQFNGLHINQTLVAVAFRNREERAQ